MVEQGKSKADLVPKIIDAGPFHICGEAAAFSETDLPEVEILWDKFNKRREQVNAVVEKFAIGICLGSHPQIVQNSAQSLVYLAGVPVSEYIDVPDGMLRCDLPAQKYAVFTHSGSRNNLLETVKLIWPDWMPANPEGYRHSGKPELELYDSRYDFDKRAGEIDIYIPVHRN